MEMKKQFERIMEEQTEMALATTVDGKTNVRIVNFVYDAPTNTLYFATLKDRQKVAEIAANPYVCCTTVPRKGTETVKICGEVRQAEPTIYELGDRFVARAPHYQEIITQHGEDVIVYALRPEEAVVTLDWLTVERISL